MGPKQLRSTGRTTGGVGAMDGLRVILALALALPAMAVSGREPSLIEVVGRYAASRPATAPASGIEVAFSPDQGAEDLVVKFINSAQKSLRVAAYSFTSKPIAEALVSARKRGVDVQIVVDKSQKQERYTSATFTANSGIPTRVDSQYAIFHNKFIVADETHVETGSFNFTASAAHRNAENVLLIWNNPQLAKAYLAKWQGYWSESENYDPRY